MKDALAPTVAGPEGPSLRPIAGRFELRDLLGEGGMGRVFRAHDHELDEAVAVKVLHADVALGAEALQRFRREVKLARRVTHRNVARMFDLGVDGALRFLTMELIDGESLARRARRGPVGVDEALRITAEIARGLAAAHQVGVIHRDLKPENVMLEVGADARVVLTDFGIARARDEDPRHATRSIIGTPAYMSPEQAEGRPLGPASDVFSLGVLLFELLTGSLPFTSDSVVASAAARLTAPAPDVRAMVSDIPSSVAELVAELLTRDARARLDGAGALRRLEALRGVGDPSHLPAAPLQLRAAAPVREVRVVVAPFVAGGVPEWVASELAAACADAAAAVRRVRLCRPVGAVGRDSLELGRATEAAWTVEGSVVASAGQLRVRLALLDVARATQVASVRLDGDLEQPLGLESQLARIVTEWLEPRASSLGGRGPSDTRALAAYQRALEGYRAFSLEGVDAAISALEEARLTHDADPYLASGLAAALLRRSLLRDAADDAELRRAQGLALRAIALDPELPEALATIGSLRWHSGELRDAVASFREAVLRAPDLPEPQLHLSSLLCKTGDLEQGSRRLRVLQQADPTAVAPYLYEVLALGLSDVSAALAVVARGEAATGHRTGFYLLRWRLALWHGLRELGAEVLAASSEDFLQREQIFTQAHLPVVRRFVEGELTPSDVEPAVTALLSYRALPLSEVTFLQHAVELALAGGAVDRARQLFDLLARRPFVDVAWVDRCPLLAPLRSQSSFAEARARIATRAAELWT